MKLWTDVLFDLKTCVATRRTEKYTLHNMPLLKRMWQFSHGTKWKGVLEEA